MKHYNRRDAMALDQSGGYYCRHVQALTAEALHEKSDIAAELAHRDRVIDSLAGLVEMLCGRNQLKFTDPLMRAPIAIDALAAITHDNPWIKPEGVK